MSSSIQERIRERVRKASIGRIVGSILLGVAFLAISALVVENMVSIGIGDIWALALAVAGLWIVFVVLMKFLLWNDNLSGD